VVIDLSTLLDRIDAALGADLDVDAIEHTLTDGYAYALELEAERLRLERRIGDVARGISQADAADRATELSELSDRLARADGDLLELRGHLTTLRQHADSVRAA
jgi:hypothetical protein